MTRQVLFSVALAFPCLMPPGKAFGQQDSLNYSQEFDHPFSFPGTICRKPVTFKDATFLESASFPNVRFMETAQFTDAAFSTFAKFTGAHFEKEVYFDDVTFAKNAYFDNATFSTFAKFTNLQQTDSTQMDFSNATLPDTLDFSENPALKCNIDLTTANFTDSSRYDDYSGKYQKPHEIFLYRTDISKFHLDYFHFRLLLPDFTLSPTYQSRREKISIDDKEVIYESLLNNFKLNGQMESYKALDIEFQAFQWRHSWARWLSWVPLVWWNYGYDKEYIFFWIIGLLLIFITINFFYLDVLSKFVYRIDAIPENTAEAPPKDKIWYSAKYTAYVFFSLTLDISKFSFQKLFPTLYFLFIYIMGILCLGYLANFILQK